MYPNLYYAFKDLFGLEFPFLRFVNTFGFFVALAFLAGAWVLSREMGRKSKAGFFTPTESELIIGEPASWSELSALSWLLVSDLICAVLSATTWSVVRPDTWVVESEAICAVPSATT